MTVKELKVYLNEFEDSCILLTTLNGLKLYRTNDEDKNNYYCGEIIFDENESADPNPNP